MNRTLKIFSSILFLMLLMTQIGLSQVRLPKLVSDGMILQREATVKIWGWASVGEKVALQFRNQSFNTITGNDGKWLITLPAQKAGGPFEMKIVGSNQIILKDILFGDVWLCSGQSNMELPMRRVAVLYGNDIAASANPMIRQFLVPVKWNYIKPQHDIQGGKWEEANPQNVLSFSAVGYFFARDLYTKYKVPVGIILCAAGGSSAESWISEESLKTFPEQYKIAKQLSDTTYMRNLLASEKTAQWKWFDELGKSDIGRKTTPWLDPSFNDSSWPSYQLPSSFAEAGMDFKNGAVWFRKEIDLPESCSGKQALLELGRIVDSDSVFINGKFVGTTTYQYPPRRYTIAPGILKAGKNNLTVRVVSQSGNGGFIKEKPYQLDVDGQIFDLKGTWKYNIGAKCSLTSSTFFPGKPLGLYNAMAVTIGLGEKNDIHPLRKKEVGQRLALAAEKLAYRDKKVVASGPICQSMKVKGNKIELSFSEYGSGLTTNDGKDLKHFSIAGADGKYIWAQSMIEGKKVIVWNEAISNPEAVRYAWADNPEGANLYNAEGLPASPFTTEK